jgi:hypothetical protein
MTDDAASRSERRALELLPWYVNGTLDGAERDEVQRALRSSLTCRLEYERLGRLQAVMQGDDAEHAAADRGFERLMARIHASAPRREATGTPRWRGLRFAQAAAVLALASSVAWWGLQRAGREPGAFETLTVEEPAASQAPQLRLVFARDLPEPARAALLAELGLTLAAPPTADGIYTLALPEGADARAMAERLRADPRIAFVATPSTPGTP